MQIKTSASLKIYLFSIIAMGMCCYGFPAYSEESIATTENRGLSPNLFYAGSELDSLFGFKAFAGTILPLNEVDDLIFYSILYTSPYLGGIKVVGAAALPGPLPLEFGIGYARHFLRRTLTLSGNLGIGNGNFLSTVTAGRAQFLDAVVPILKVEYSGELFEGQTSVKYWIATRSNPNFYSQNLVLYKLNGGIKFGRFYSAGLVYEQSKQFLHSPENFDSSVNLSQWTGAYFQIQMPNYMSLNFSGGIDASPAAEASTTDKTSFGDWYKAVIVIPFMT